jgi:cold-inducible RNA-binding protein
MCVHSIHANVIDGQRGCEHALPQRFYMSNKLYVGNLSFNTTENELQDLFAGSGAVQEVILIQDRVTGRSKGFGFVTMANAEDAKNAISQINGKSIGGRALTVNEARPKEDRPPGGGGGGGGRRDFGGPPRGGGGGGRDRR